VVLNQVVDQLNYTEGLSRQRKRSYESAGYTVPTMDQAPSFTNTYGEPTPSTTPGSTMPEAGGAAPTTPTAPSSKPMPTGARLKTYADTYFEGDEEEARKSLASQGYK